MALTQEDFVGAVAKLNDLTRRQVIKWSPCDPPRRAVTGAIGLALSGLSDEVAQAFEAFHEGRIVRVSRYAGQGGGILGLKPDRYILDVRDEDGNAMFEFPGVAGISDLFQSVRTQRLDIEGFIKKLVAG